MTYALAVLAGVLTTLSPCVLPILPMIVGAALAEDRAAPLALAAGMAVSFAAIGVAIATVGFALGLDAGLVRSAGAAVMAALGVILLSPALQTRLAAAGSGVLAPATDVLASGRFAGARGQFGLGLLLGVVWSPCVGPTLGGALALAGVAGNAGSAAATMTLFALGAALPLLAIAYGARQALLRRRIQVAALSAYGRAIMGVTLLGFGILVLSGADKWVEAYLTERMPDWLLVLVTRV